MHQTFHNKFYLHCNVSIYDHCLLETSCSALSYHSLAWVLCLKYGLPDTNIIDLYNSSRSITYYHHDHNDIVVMLWSTYPRINLNNTGFHILNLKAISRNVKQNTFFIFHLFDLFDWMYSEVLRNVCFDKTSFLKILAWKTSNKSILFCELKNFNWLCCST